MTAGMKFAISVSQPIFDRLEKVARRQKSSRSAIVQAALESYLAQNESDLTARINRALEGLEREGVPAPAWGELEAW